MRGATGGTTHFDFVGELARMFEMLPFASLSLGARASRRRC
jgi:hypothetical protein